MPVARFIVCERTATWGVALRRPLKQIGRRIVETRSLDDCWSEVAASPASLVGVEATTSNLASLVPWLQRLTATFPRTRVVVLGSRGLEAGEWLLREAGAAHVVFSPRQWQPVVRIAQRHLGAPPCPDDSERQRIWRRLPWADAAEVT
jgi:uracil-DNA glycosylase